MDDLVSKVIGTLSLIISIVTFITTPGTKSHDPLSTDPRRPSQHFPASGWKNSPPPAVVRLVQLFAWPVLVVDTAISTVL